jgi:hypothetical protein
MKGSPFMIFPYLQILFPIAGILGLIPVVFISYLFLEVSQVFVGNALLLPYIFLPFAIFLQKKVCDKIKRAINENPKRDPVFKVVVLHHLWTNGCIFYILYFIHDRPPMPISWPFIVVINFLIAIIVWR